MVNYPDGSISDEELEAARQADLQRELAGIDTAVDRIKVTLTPQHRDLINFVEHYWYQNQTYPSTAAMHRWSVEQSISFDICRQLELDVTPYLYKRGITPSKANSRLTDAQLAAANLILNFTDKRSKAKKLSSLGITTTQWDGWLRQKTFKEYLANRTGEVLDNNHDVAHLGLLSAVEKGQTQALELYYKITGLYREDSPQANVNLLMTLLIEVIQREVNDPDVLRRIAAGFELVMLRQTTGLATGQPTAISDGNTGVYAGQPEVIEHRDLALDRVNVRVSNQNPPSQEGTSALQF